MGRIGKMPILLIKAMVVKIKPPEVERGRRLSFHKSKSISTGTYFKKTSSHQVPGGFLYLTFDYIRKFLFRVITIID